MSARETERKTQLKGETERKQRRTEIFWRNKPAKSKGFVDNNRAAWPCLFKQHCGNQRGKGNIRGLITEKCCAEPAVPIGKPERPLCDQPPELGAVMPPQELPAGHHRGCRWGTCPAGACLAAWRAGSCEAPHRYPQLPAWPEPAHLLGLPRAVGSMRTASPAGTGEGGTSSAPPDSSWQMAWALWVEKSLQDGRKTVEVAADFAVKCFTEQNLQHRTVVSQVSKSPWQTFCRLYAGTTPKGSAEELQNILPRASKQMKTSY